MKVKSGFTLVEILIIVVILGVLAAIVVPQFTEASTEAKMSSLCTDLQTVRSQIELYKVQHNNALPGAGRASFVDALTQKTDMAGALNPAGPYGPYVREIPINAFNDMDTVRVEAGNTGLGGGDTGWHFDSTTGAFHADTNGHVGL